MINYLKEYLRINAIQRLFSFVRVKRSEIFGLVMFSMAFAVLEGLGVSFLLPILQYAEQGESILSAGGGSIYWEAFGKALTFLHLEPSLIVLLVMAFIPILLRNVVFFFRAWYSNAVSSSIMIRLRMRVLRVIYDADPEFYQRYPVGKLVDVSINQTGAASTSVLGVINLIGIVMLIVVYVAILLMLSVPLTVSAVLFAALVALVNKAVLKKISESSLASAKRGQILMAKIVERMGQMRLIKLRNTKKQEEQYVSDVSEEMRQISIKIAKVGAGVEVIVDPLMMLSVFVTLYLGVAVLGSTLAQLGLLLLILTRLNAKVREFNAGLQSLSTSAAGVKLVQQMYDAAIKANTIKSGSLSFKGITKEIELKGVGFDYPDVYNEEGVLLSQGKKVLSNINASIKKGSFTALVGRSGAGKSTLVEMLPRMREATEGEVLYDGESIRSFEIGSLRRGISYVTQSPMLFNDTVYENLIYGLGYVPSEERIRGALEDAYASFVYDLPNGLETHIGDAGARFSGGERQRIAIARALLEETDVLIFDEPTSALDSESEGYIQETLSRLHGRKTLIVIAHRLATVIQADQLLVLNEGEIVERGTHKELLDMGNVYAQLFKRQLIEVE